MIEHIKNAYHHLQDRERRLLSIGSVILALLFIYGFIWSPLSTSVSNYKITLQSQRQLLQYLQRASTKIQQLNASGIHIASTHSADLLMLAEETLSQQTLSPFLKQVAQPQPNQITLTFENVPFDKLMQWLQTLAMKQGVQVSQLSATKSSVVGAANVTMVLSLS